MTGPEVQLDPSVAAATSTSGPGSVFAILNPMAGSAAADAIRRVLGECVGQGGGSLEIHETAEGEDLNAVVKAAAARGADLVVAAGGDGTISAVADALVGSGTPLAIIPMGTANVLARELNIPLDLDAACRLLAGEHDLASVDAMKVGDRSYFTQVGVGLDALMIRDTSTAHKRRFGKLAYMWSACRHLMGHQPVKFVIEIDGKAVKRRASQVVVANVGVLGQPPFRWGPDIRPDDGTLDVFVSKAKTVLHYLALAWHVVRHKHKADPNVRYYHARRSVAIKASKRLPVQADGEIIGEVPVRIDVEPGAVKIVVPRAV